MDAIKLTNVRVRLKGATVLEDITLSVPVGDFAALIGQNGAGKTILLKVILGLIRPGRGHVRLFGEPVAAFQGWERVGYIPQHAVRIDPRFPASVREVASLGRVAPRGLLRFLSAHDHEAVDRALDTVRMRAKARQRVGALSGGELQRVMIARALATEPDLLILDEPAAGVDPGTQEGLYGFLRELNEERGLTILLSTHDLGAVMEMARTVACINRRLVCHRPAAEGLTAEELVQTYGSPLAAATHSH
ncbi:MAG: metal ABC transporter ATP-binding protein [Thermoplasmata archaeon]